MNVYQAIALSAYAIVLFLFVYFGSNKFEKGWMTKRSGTNKYNLDVNSFKLIAVVLVGGMVLILKWLSSE
jgi:hypothetical protein